MVKYSMQTRDKKNENTSGLNNINTNINLLNKLYDIDEKILKDKDFINFINIFYTEEDINSIYKNKKRLEKIYSSYKNRKNREDIYRDMSIKYAMKYNTVKIAYFMEKVYNSISYISKKSKIVYSFEKNENFYINTRVINMKTDDNYDISVLSLSDKINYENVIKNYTENSERRFFDIKVFDVFISRIAINSNELIVPKILLEKLPDSENESIIDQIFFMNIFYDIISKKNLSYYNIIEKENKKIKIKKINLKSDEVDSKLLSYLSGTILYRINKEKNYISNKESFALDLAIMSCMVEKDNYIDVLMLSK